MSERICCLSCPAGSFCCNYDCNNSDCKGFVAIRDKSFYFSECEFNFLFGPKLKKKEED